MRSDERWFPGDRKSNETRDSVTFELASKFDLAGQMLPKRQVVAIPASGSTEAASAADTGTDYYDVNGNEVSTEAEDVCGKRVASCKLRFGENGDIAVWLIP